MFLAKINQLFHKNKKIFYYIGFFLVAYSLSSDITFASVSDPIRIEDISEKVGIFAEGALKGLSVFLAIITYLATLFLSPEWINGTAFGLDSKFKLVWILVSNVVYFVFAFILVWIAFMNIIGKNNDQYQLKQALPKFVVGVLIVPFSWFLVQFILSISAILTVSALTLPYDLFSDKEGVFNTDEIKIPKHCVINLKGKSNATATADKFFDCPTGTADSLSSTLSSGNSIEGIFSLMSMYTYGLINISEVASVKKADYTNITLIGDLVVKIVFDLIFVLVYLILMITLGMVLVVRGIYIWIYTMISPVFGLMYFFDKKEGGDGFFGKFNLKEFIALSMVPVYTMLALSFGILFIYTVGTGFVSGSNILRTEVGDDGSSKITIGATKTYSLTVKGTPGTSGADATNFINAIGGGALGIIGSLIMKLFGIIILRGTIMAAMRTSEITKQITQPIYDFGNQVGKIAASGPANIPIFPGGQSMKSMGTIAGSVQSSINSKQIDRAGKFTKEHMPFLDNGGMDRNLDAEKIASKVNGRSEGITDALRSDFKELLAKYKDSPNSMMSDPGFKSAMIAIGKAAGVEDIDKANFSTMDSIAKTAVGKVEAKLDGHTVGGVSEGRNVATDFSEDWLKDITKIAAGGDDNSEAKIDVNQTKDIEIKIADLSKKTGTRSAGAERLNPDEITAITGQIINQDKLVGVFTEPEFIRKLRGDHGLTEDEANTIVKEIAKEIDKDTKFFKEPDLETDTDTKK